MCVHITKIPKLEYSLRETGVFASRNSVVRCAQNDAKLTNDVRRVSFHRFKNDNIGLVFQNMGFF